MSQLPITNVVSISVSQAQLGLGEYNVNNLAVFTKDAPAHSFGTRGYALYLEPTSVATDFGSSSATAGVAEEVFSQQPNILAGGGYLAAITLYTPTQVVTLTGGDPVMGFQLSYGSSHISVTDSQSASAIQVALQTIVTSQTPGVTVTVSGNFAAGGPVTFSFSGGNFVYRLSCDEDYTNAATFETLAAAITRTQGLVNYFGIVTSYLQGSTEATNAAAVTQPLKVMLFTVSNDESALASPSGYIYALAAAGLSHTRGLYYGGTSAAAVNWAAGYAGRALSTNFNGSNTTETMHLKQIIGSVPDSSLTQAILMEAITAGADTYPSLQGVPAVFCSGENQYFDDVYNLQWLIGALEVAGFNYLAQSSTKVPQTEQGMNGLKGAYRAVLQQAVANQFLAPGAWTSSTTFGNQVDFLANISTYGYYIYSTPISQQSAASRAARQAPLIQIAIKYAGAIQSSDVVVFVNA